MLCDDLPQTIPKGFYKEREGACRVSSQQYDVRAVCNASGNEDALTIQVTLVIESSWILKGRDAVDTGMKTDEIAVIECHAERDVQSYISRYRRIAVLFIDYNTPQKLDR